MPSLAAIWSAVRKPMPRMGQAVWVFRDQPDGIGAVSLVDAHRARRANRVAVQEQHYLADHLLFGPAGDDPLRALGANAGHLPQPTRLPLDNVEHGLAEGPHELLRVDRPDAADHAGAQVLLDALDRRRRRSLEKRGFELDAVRAVVDPGPARLDELAGGDHCGMPDKGDEIALASGFDAQHAEAVVGIMKGDAVDQSRQDLRRAHRESPCNPQGLVCRQCRVGLVVDAEFGIRRRARVQDNNAAWISRSQISVNSLMWRRVCAMSSADAGFVRSRATSQTPRSKPPASASVSRARRARSGSARPRSFPNIPSMNPITSSRRVAAIFARPSLVSGASTRIIRNGAFLFW